MFSIFSPLNNSICCQKKKKNNSVSENSSNSPTHELISGMLIYVYIHNCIVLLENIRRKTELISLQNRIAVILSLNNTSNKIIGLLNINKDYAEIL